MGSAKSACLKIEINPKIYPLSAIYGAAYVFVDKVYIFFDGDPEKKVEVFLKAKSGIGSQELAQIKGDFENELLNYALREQIVKSSQKIRETIIAQALLSPLYNSFPDLMGDAQNDEYLEDPLGIAKTWEERFEKKKSKKKC